MRHEGVIFERILHSIKESFDSLTTTTAIVTRESTNKC